MFVVGLILVVLGFAWAWQLVTRHDRLVKAPLWERSIAILMMAVGCWLMIISVLVLLWRVMP